MLHILLVEDNPGDARLTQESLRDAGGLLCDTVHAKCLREARDYLRKNAADIVLLDLSLPDGEGLTSVRGIVDSSPEVPVVVLTGLDDESVALDAIREGAQDYLIKGQFDGKLLARVIRYSVERKQAALEKERMKKEQQELFSQVQTLRSLLPMCAWCKKIKDENGNWQVLEKYITDHSSSDITHGICPECNAKLQWGQ